MEISTAASLQPNMPPTQILRVDAKLIGDIEFEDSNQGYLGPWKLQLSESSDAANLSRIAQQLQVSDIPVAIPTETVYGLAADATRSAAVQGIFRAKQRPSDNPLIVHIYSPAQLQNLGSKDSPSQLEIPPIYTPLISRFWPGPLTILLPLPSPSPFAPEVTVGLPNVGIRMPSNPLTLALIKLAGVPLAAPSANASTKPSTTTAAHVLQDLNNRIEYILDGGPCRIGLESTIVDGLSSPPTILRPGGVSLENLRSCPGWENTQIGYEQPAQTNMAPRAPGMKYKHYAPRAPVTLFRGRLGTKVLTQWTRNGVSVGIIFTTNRDIDTDLFDAIGIPGQNVSEPQQRTVNGLSETSGGVWVSALGPGIVAVAQKLFSTLRAMDDIGVDEIFIEVVADEVDEGAAVMNRLRKAAGREIDL